MTTYSTINKNSTSYTGSPRVNGNLILAGMPIGLLLSLTYSALAGLTTYTAVSKNTTTYSTISKN